MVRRTAPPAMAAHVTLHGRGSLLLRKSTPGSRALVLILQAVLVVGLRGLTVSALRLVSIPTAATLSTTAISTTAAAIPAG